MIADLENLITLQDLDYLCKEIKSPEYQKLGFQVDEKERLAQVEKAREEIRKRIPENIVKRYDKLKARYGRGVAPVVGGVCLNCFVHLPIAFVSQPGKNERIDTCPNCGIFIYWK
jgi:hypothetical protein